MRIFLLLLVMVLIATFPFISDWMAKNKTEVLYDKDHINSMIEGYIKDHPDQIMLSLQEYNKVQREDAYNIFVKNALEENIDKIKDDRYPTFGLKDGVRVVEFFDYACGYCKKMRSTIDDVIEGSNVYYTFREIPIINGSNSDIAVRAALAVNIIDKSKYLSVNKALLEYNGMYNDDVINGIVETAGIDQEEFNRVRESREVTDMLEDSIKLFNSLGINGTPAFIIGDELVVGAMDLKTLRDKIKGANK